MTAPTFGEEPENVIVSNSKKIKEIQKDMVAKKEKTEGENSASAFFSVNGSKTLTFGWGGRTRTSEWQNQNLLNYQLFYTPTVSNLNR